MSAYSEWKYGLIDDSEYTRICNQEAWEERAAEEAEWAAYLKGENDYYDEEEDDEYDIYFD